MTTPIINPAAIVLAGWLLALGGSSFGQTARPRNLNAGVDTTRKSDVMLAVVHLELPAAVRAGERLAGRFTVQNVGHAPLDGTYRARLVYENRDTYRHQAQDLGRLEGHQLPPGTEVERTFEVAVPAGLPSGSTKVKLMLTPEGEDRPLALPMKYEGPPGLFPLGKVNVLGKPGRKKKRVVFFGDSVTQEAPMPDGYVSQLEALGGPVAGWELIGAGVGGDRVTSLRDRADADVLIYRPQTVVVYVGVNDCGFFKWVPAVGGTEPAAYERELTALVRKFRRHGIRVVLCTPAVIGEKRPGENELDASLEAYVRACHAVAGREGCPLVDLRAAFTQYLQIHNPQNQAKGILTTDGVHLTRAGNALAARELHKIFLGQDSQE
ncbi:MAG: lipase/acylhydrolase family protein [uncultured Cytophagales bacterium]|uniref:Lipase/acylhydrolase family protein n=1 Tax=uncultured Cytophagales bacterium TaxID=158755 RepID=A0A6J4LUY2_9SPHI|nr:MAG: lipase/acylhydrolase family protein [uncultured Cytophagales bacterium]